MARVTLKSILSKKNDASSLVLSFIEQMNAHISIEDEKGIFLCGNPEYFLIYQHPVNVNDEIIGWVKGDEKAIHIAGFLHCWHKKNLKEKILAVKCWFYTRK